MKVKSYLLGIVLCLMITTPLVANVTFAQSQLMPPMKGMTITAWSAEAYSSPDFDQSITNLANTGANWVTFTIFWFMNTSTSNIIERRLDLYTSSDSSLIHAIQKANELAMQVCLKPMVDVADGSWRGTIAPTNWTLWFQNYRTFIDFYADMAQTYSVELFTVGCELRSSQSRTSDWITVINEARTHYSGNMTYSANWDSYGTGSIGFWGSLDFVGVDAYFPLTSTYNPTLQQLISAWSVAASGWWGTNRNWTNDLYTTYVQTGKKIIFTEIGYTSQNGTNTQPWTWNVSPVIDLQEQADCYQAAIEVFKSKSWFMGWFWWNWQTNPSAGGPTDDDYTPQNKPAQGVLNQYYYYEAAPDVSVTSATCSKTGVEPGGTVDIQVTVANQGINTETFNLTTYANSTAIETQTIMLANGSSTVTNFLWDTSGFENGNYTVEAYAWPLPYEIDIADNILVAGYVFVGVVVDVAVIDVVLSKTVVCQGFTMNAQATVQNQGSTTASFNISLTANSISMASTTVTLSAGEIQEVDFTINATGIEIGSYSIAVVAEAILHETDLADNVLIDGNIFVSLPGDIAAAPSYGTVDIFDIVQVASAFQATPGAPNWKPNADINNDGIIDIFDMVVVAVHFGDSS